MPPRKKIPVEAQSPPPEPEVPAAPEPVEPPAPPKKKYDVSPAVLEARKRTGLAAKEKRAAEAEAREEERRIARETIEILREMKAEKERKRQAKPIVVTVPEQKAPPPAPEQPGPSSHNAPPRMLAETQPVPHTTVPNASEGVEARRRSILFSDDDDTPRRSSRFTRRAPTRR